MMALAARGSCASGDTAAASDDIEGRSCDFSSQYSLLENKSFFKEREFNVLDGVGCPLLPVRNIRLLGRALNPPML
jgi:hypothetical protein